MRSRLDAPVILLAVAVVVAGMAGCYDSVVHATAHSKASRNSYRPTIARPLPEPFAGRDEVRILLMGSDTRPHDVGRADTLMVLFINPRLKKAALLSIPRDLRVHIPGHGVTKINHSYAYGGPELTRRTVEELFGLDIPYYVRIDFKTFVEAVDMLGGVDVEVPDVEGHGRGMNYDDNWGNLHIHLKPAWHHLDGYQAMGFVRYRHGDSDFARTKRQQQFMRAILAQKLKLTNLPVLLKTGSYVLKKLDTNLSWREVVDLLRIAKQMKTADLMTATLPISDAMIGGIYYAILREGAYRELMAKVRAHLAGRAETKLAVEVLNGCGVQGLARRAARRLETKGWEIAGTGNADSYDYEQTEIQYPPGGRSEAEAVAEDLGLQEAEIKEVDTGLDKIRVLLGQDYVQSRQAGDAHP